MASTRPIVWAHRGSRRKSPENTLEAFLRAEWEGADGSELDVRLTRDGIPVVMHDANLRRTTGVDAFVRDLGFRELKEAFPGVPSLEEVLRIHSRRVRLNVELKTDPLEAEGRIESLAEAVASLFGRYGDPELCMVSAFDPRAIDAFKRIAPRYPAGWLIKPSCFPGPRFTGRPTAFEAVHPHHSMVSPRFLLAARAEGKIVNVWTVNGAAPAVRLAAWGADGIITDRPSAILLRLDRAHGIGPGAEEDAA